MTAPAGVVLVVPDLWHVPLHWRAVRHRLAGAGWLEYAVALPGHGRGVACGRWPDAAVNAVVGAVGRRRDPVTVVAHGWAGAIAAAAVARIPDRVARLVLAGGVLPSDTGSLWEEMPQAARDGLRPGFDHRAGVVTPPEPEAWRRWFAAGLPRALLYRLYTTLVAAPVSAFTAPVNLTDFRGLVAAGTVPVTYLCPAEDEAYGLGGRWRDYAAGLGGLTHVADLPGCHEQMVTHPVRVADAIHTAAGRTVASSHA